MISRARLLAAPAAVLLSLTPLLLGGCGEEKMAPVPVGQLEDYRDPGFGFHISYPAGWVSNSDVGSARFYNTQEVINKFLQPTGDYPFGVKITVDVQKTGDSAKTFQAMKDDLTQNEGVTLGQESPVTVAEHAATKIPYSANYGGKNILKGYVILLAADSLAYKIGFAGFGPYFDAYAAVFDASLKSFVLPKRAAKGQDETIPSETMETYTTNYFTYDAPVNFATANVDKGSFEFSQQLHGYRQDCSIRFDVFDAKGLTVEKVFDQNKSRYRPRGTGKATIGGEPAQYVNYAATAQVDSRAYFVVHKGKVVRITLNWYKPQDKIYLPVFEKMIASIKFK